MNYIFKSLFLKCIESDSHNMMDENNLKVTTYFMMEDFNRFFRDEIGDQSITEINPCKTFVLG